VDLAARFLAAVIRPPLLFFAMFFISSSVPLPLNWSSLALTGRAW
jgi:hypothetical protein